MFEEPYITVVSLGTPNKNCALEAAHIERVAEVVAIKTLSQAEKVQILLKEFFYRCDIEGLPFIDHTEKALIFRTQRP